MEIVACLRNCRVHNLQVMNGSDDRRLVPDDSRFGQQCHLNITVASTLAQPTTRRIYSNTPGHHEIDRRHLPDVDQLPKACGFVAVSSRIARPRHNSRVQE
ncbi:hypothetical protein APR04_005738 [Promicromonospora umidemergens]|nr:hypothetical protein [Promicromonospora umidemergens]